MLTLILLFLVEWNGVRRCPWDMQSMAHEAPFHSVVYSL